MTDFSLRLDAADEHGFLRLGDLRRNHAGNARDAFLRAFPLPALLAVYEGQTESGLQKLFPEEPDDASVQLLTITTKSHGFLRYLGKLAFITKRPGSPFAHLVSIGRSPQNDITIAVDSVSKVHGYFVSGEGGWQYTDHGSTNGSMVGDQLLEKGNPHTIEPGQLLRLGPEVMFELLSPEVLYERLQRT